MAIKRLFDADLHGQTVIMRVDFNCPVDGSNEAVHLTDFSRIDDHIQTTLKPIFDLPKPPKNVVLLAHQGRRGKKDCINLRQHFEHCRSELQQSRVKTFYVWEEIDDEEVKRLGEDAVSGPEVLARIRRLRDRSVLLLENVRFSEFEDQDSDGSVESFAETPMIRMLRQVDNSSVALDGFSVAHRAQASVVGLANIGSLHAGPVVMREIEQLSLVVESPEEPMVLVVGGGKIDDSLQSVERFLRDKKAHKVLTGGLVAMAFLAADRERGVNRATEANIRKATTNLDRTLALCQRLRHTYPDNIQIPTDVAVRVGQNRRNLTLDAALRHSEEYGDIGIETLGRYLAELTRARTIVMNGPLGRYESTPMAFGTKEVLRCSGLVAREKGTMALIGGGDTSAAVREVEFAGNLRQCSSGKAFLEVLASGDVNSLVGIRALARSDSERGPLRVVAQRSTSVA